MKKLKTGLLINWNRLLRIFMSILGFSAGTGLTISCDSWNGRVEYGTPSAKFIVNGQVKSEQTTTAVPNIRVVMSEESGETAPDTTYTDASGNYSVDITAFPGDKNFILKFEDIDGTTNGSFENLESEVDFTDPKYTNGSGNWYEGETSQTLNVNLKTKE